MHIKFISFIQVSIELIFQPQAEVLTTATPEFIVKTLVKSSNVEEIYRKHNNNYTLTIPINLEPKVRVTGISNPGLVRYNSNILVPPGDYNFEEDIGEAVIHTYYIQNLKPYTVSEVEVEIMWPSLDSLGNPLLYLLGFEFNQLLARCQASQDINPLSLKVRFT